MERVMGFEPTASTLARLRSSQLSYTRGYALFAALSLLAAAFRRALGASFNALRQAPGDNKSGGKGF